MPGLRSTTLEPFEPVSQPRSWVHWNYSQGLVPVLLECLSQFRSLRERAGGSGLRERAARSGLRERDVRSGPTWGFNGNRVGRREVLKLERELKLGEGTPSRTAGLILAQSSGCSSCSRWLDLSHTSRESGGILPPDVHVSHRPEDQVRSSRGVFPPERISLHGVVFILQH